MTRIVLFAISALTLASPAAAQVDPVARAMATQALSVATAPTTMKTTIVGGEQPDTPAVAGSSGTVGNSPIQVNGSAANDTGYLAFKHGADAKGVTNYWVKTRSPAMNGYAAAVALVRNGYLTATATGTVSQLTTFGTTLPAGTYAVTFNAPGA